MSSSVGPREAARLIASRDFGPYFVGNALSASGTWFHTLAAGILIFRLTGSELLLGVLGFAQFIPVLLLAPWAGNAADRLDRPRLVLAISWPPRASARSSLRSRGPAPRRRPSSSSSRSGSE